MSTPTSPLRAGEPEPGKPTTHIRAGVSPDGAAAGPVPGIGSSADIYLPPRGHPPGLFLLFVVEMWERFSYYGMRGLLVLYLIARPTADNPGRGWTEKDANYLYGWYTGLVYLLPLIGGYLADKLLGTHRSMVLGALLITLGHIVLGITGLPALEHSELGMSLFVGGLALIIIGTGYFKPCVTVMVGQLYPPGDPRREGAFTIFYMGINVGAFICAFICGTLGENVGWHWGFGSAAVGMILGLVTYLIGRPYFLQGIGLPPPGRSATIGVVLFAISLVLAAGYTVFWHAGGFSMLAGTPPVQMIADLARTIDTTMASANLPWLTSGVLLLLLLVAGCLVATIWFVVVQKPSDRGPVLTIFIFMLFNAFFWIAFEQAGSTLNVFAKESTNREMNVGWLDPFQVGAIGLPVLMLLITASLWGWKQLAKSNTRPRLRVGLLVTAITAATLLVGGVILVVLMWLTETPWPEMWEVPATWFQSVNPLLIIALAPLFAILWTALGKRHLDPSQPAKIGIALILVGLGYVFVVYGAWVNHTTGARVSMFWLLALYTVHTVGELFISPTGLSYVTRTAPERYVSLLMGIWFISSFLAGYLGGLIASYVEDIERGKVELPWNIGGRADFFTLFVVVSTAAGLLILALTPLFKKMMRPEEFKQVPAH